jgi:hypothetical protein
MTIIHSDMLSPAEHKMIEGDYAPHHHYAEFWVGFIDYQHRRQCPRGWENSVAGQAWDRGAEAAMTTLRNRSQR